MQIKTLLLASVAVLEQATHGAHVNLHTFSPYEMAFDTGLTLVNGQLYGMIGGSPSSTNSESGSVFRLNRDGTGFTTLHTFLREDQDVLNGTLTYSSGKLYGTARTGTVNVDGTLFRMNLDGSDFEVVHYFGGEHGSFPGGPVTIDGTVIYGTTRFGGGGFPENIYRVNTDGTGFTVLHHFSGVADGMEPAGGLILDGLTLYGVTTRYGRLDGGTVFRIDTDGSGFQTLCSLPPDSSNSPPSSSLSLIGSTLYGETPDAIYRVNTDGTGFDVIHEFEGGPEDGLFAAGGLMVIGSKLYGATGAGGAHDAGTVFSINADGSGFEILDSLGPAETDPAFYAGYSAGAPLVFDGENLYGLASSGGDLTGGAVFAVPVPEPATLGLFAAGALLLFRRPQKRCGLKVPRPLVQLTNFQREH